MVSYINKCFEYMYEIVFEVNRYQICLEAVRLFSCFVIKNLVAICVLVVPDGSVRDILGFEPLTDIVISCNFESIGIVKTFELVSLISTAIKFTFLDCTATRTKFNTYNIR